MLSRLFHLIFFVSLLTGVLAYPLGAVEREPVSQCNTGDAQCCQEVVSADNAKASELLHLLGIAVVGKTAVGLTCTPITVIGVSGCHASPVCCKNNTFNGIVALNGKPLFS
ncbi:hydrophobin 2 [Mycena vulgaris]|nr:hydrophobin 2 [Mycena vulgaris]